MVGNVALLETPFGWLAGWCGRFTLTATPDELKRWRFRLYFAPIEDEVG